VDRLGRELLHERGVVGNKDEAFRLLVERPDDGVAGRDERRRRELRGGGIRAARGRCGGLCTARRRCKCSSRRCRSAWADEGQAHRGAAREEKRTAAAFRVARRRELAGKLLCEEETRSPLTLEHFMR
jgi:hypothetical protein